MLTIFFQKNIILTMNYLINSYECNLSFKRYFPLKSICFMYYLFIYFWKYMIGEIYPMFNTR